MRDSGFHLEASVAEVEGFSFSVKETEVLAGDLMMLPSDLVLIQDRSFRKYVEIYAKDPLSDDFSYFFENKAGKSWCLLARGLFLEPTGWWEFYSFKMKTERSPGGSGCFIRHFLLPFETLLYSLVTGVFHPVFTTGAWTFGVSPLR